MKTRSAHQTPIFLFSILIALCSFTTYAQQGTSSLTVQLGIAGSTQGNTVKTPAFYGTYQYFVGERLALGGIVGYSQLSFTNFEFVGGGREVEEVNDNIIAGGLLNYYFFKQQTFGIYGGTAMGYASGKTGTFLYEIHGGFDYFMTDTISLHAELGVGLSLLKFGVSFGI